MGQRVCPCWMRYLLACRLRRFAHDPRVLLAPYIREGMTVLEPGPGVGFFTLDLLEMVGRSGRVIAVDLQPKMLEALRRRAAKRGLEQRLDCRTAAESSMGLRDVKQAVDFVLAFYVVHEFPTTEQFFREAHEVLRQGAQLFLAEPAMHVTKKDFSEQLDTARRAGLEVVSPLKVKGSHAALLRRL